jgi:hypothetical protein
MKSIVPVFLLTAGLLNATSSTTSDPNSAQKKDLSSVDDAHVAVAPRRVSEEVQPVKEEQRIWTGSGISIEH